MNRNEQEDALCMTMKLRAVMLRTVMLRKIGVCNSIQNNNYDYINTRGINSVKRLNWMTVKQQIIYLTVNQMFKCIHGLAPQYLCNSIVLFLFV